MFGGNMMINLRSLILSGFAFFLSNFSCSAGWFDLPKKGTMACVGEDACFNTPSSCDSQEAFDNCYANCLQGKVDKSAKENAEKLFSCPQELIANSKFRSDIENSAIYQELFQSRSEESAEMPPRESAQEVEQTDSSSMAEVPDMPDMAETPEMDSEEAESSPFLKQPLDDSMGMAHHQEDRPEVMHSNPDPESLQPIDSPYTRQQENFGGENPLESSPPSPWQSSSERSMLTEDGNTQEDDPSMQGILQNTMIGEMVNPNF
jgi:hypothetical protein